MNHQVQLFVLLLSSILLILFSGCTADTQIPGIPYTVSQFINKTTTTDYNSFISGDHNGMFLFVDWNKIGFIDANFSGGGGNVDVNGKIIYDIDGNVSYNPNTREIWVDGNPIADFTGNYLGVARGVFTPTLGINAGIIWDTSNPTTTRNISIDSGTRTMYNDDGNKIVQWGNAGDGLKLRIADAWNLPDINGSAGQVLTMSANNRHTEWTTITGSVDTNRQTANFADEFDAQLQDFNVNRFSIVDVNVIWFDGNKDIGILTCPDGNIFMGFVRNKVC